MKNYTDLTDLGTPTADHPSGVLVEGTAGTLWNKAFASDAFEFFWKCVRDAGITPNNNFDNVSNGYQLFDAVRQALPFGGDEMTITSTSGSPYSIPDNVSIVKVTLPDNDTPSITPPSPTKGRRLSIYCTTPQTDARDWVFQSGTDSSFYLPESPFAGTSLYSVLMEADGNKWHVLSYTGVFVACPFVYINGAYIDEIIKNQVGEKANRVDTVDITESVVIGENTFKLSEEKAETSYLEYVALVVDGEKVIEFDTDLVLDEGDFREYKFNIEDGYTSVKIEAKGYYIKK